MTILKLREDVFLIDGLEVNQISLVARMLLRGVEEKEIVIGLSELEEHSHNYMNYGINGTFIFSKKVEFENEELLAC